MGRSYLWFGLSMLGGGALIFAALLGYESPGAAHEAMQLNAFSTQALELTEGCKAGHGVLIHTDCSDELCVAITGHRVRKSRIAGSSDFLFGGLRRGVATLLGKAADCRDDYNDFYDPHRLLVGISRSDRELWALSCWGQEQSNADSDFLAACEEAYVERFNDPKFSWRR